LLPAVGLFPESLQPTAESQRNEKLQQQSQNR
jgi:hypothetical protein